MCTVCGCSRPAVPAPGRRSGEKENADPAGHRHSHHHDHHHSHHHGHEHGDAHVHGDHHLHAHDHPHPHSHPHADQTADQTGGRGAEESLLDYSAQPAVLAEADGGASRILQLGRDILAENNRLATFTRTQLQRRGILAVNLISGPGAGKTSLLVRTLQALKGSQPMLVIEGDQQTSCDADRIRATGVPAVQINTGQGCHLDARMVSDALARQVPAAGTLVFIENVGNLVCPAGFDLGEAHKVVLLSVTEGEDKPLKYAEAFRAADLMLLTKVDLLPHLSFDRDTCLDYVRRVNPWMEVIEVSSRTGDGLDAWFAWLQRRQSALGALAQAVAGAAASGGI